MFRPSTLFHLSLPALLLTALPSAVSATSLSEAVRHAVAHHPEIAAADHERAATAEELARAKGAYLPRIDATVEYGSHSTESDASGDNDASPSRRLALALNQSLYEPAKLSEIDRQRFRVNAAEAGLRSLVEEVALEAVGAYLEVWRDEEVVDLSKRNVSRHRATLNKVKGRMAAGEGGVGDVKQAESRLTNARATRVDNLRILEQDRAAYRRVIGLEAEEPTLPDIPDRWLPTTLEEAVERTLDGSPALRRARSEVAAAEAALEAAQAGFLPTVNAELSASDAENASGVAGDSEEMRAMVVLRYNLYAGGGDRARKREAAARKLAASDRLNNLRRRLVEQARRAWIGMKRSDEKLALLKQQQATADRVVEIYRKEFEIGQHSLLDLLDSESERFSVRVRRIDAEKEARLARYQLLAAMGSLTGVLQQEPPPPAAEPAPAPPAEPAHPQPAPPKAKSIAPPGEEAAWVVLIADDRPRADALADELQSQGYNQYVAPLAGGRFAVSLGVYREREYALDMMDRLKRLGYQPTILPKQLP